MKKLYEIRDRNTTDAVEGAKMYGHRTAHSATFIREHN